MTGVDIIGAVLRSDPPVLPIARIKAGVLPDNVVLPALLVRLVSSVERQKLRQRIGWLRVTDRIAVTVRAASYADQTDVIEAVRKRCAGLVGAIGDGVNVVILSAGIGPDGTGPASSFEQTIDFRVSYDINL